MFSTQSPLFPPRHRLVKFLGRTAVLALSVYGVAGPRVAWAKHHRHHLSAFQIIKSVDEDAKKITVAAEHTKDHTEMAVLITPFTDIKLDGLKATLHDLKPGMSVDVDMETDNEAASLVATHVNNK